MAGGLPTGVGYTLDGATHNNPQENVNLPLPFPDALQEFRVATSGLTAQNGVHSAAAVNAVTKSGTNRFSRAMRSSSSATIGSTRRARLRRIGPDGKRLDDGLKRNQFGGTLGGPIVKDKLFFFGGLPGHACCASARRRTSPTCRRRRCWPVTSPPLPRPRATAAGRSRLRAPYVNNRIDPALFSPAALNIAKRLPSTTDPCGQITYDVKSDRDEKQTLARIDYQAEREHIRSSAATS